MRRQEAISIVQLHKKISKHYNFDSFFLYYTYLQNFINVFYQLSYYKYISRYIGDLYHEIILSFLSYFINSLTCSTLDITDFLPALSIRTPVPGSITKPWSASFLSTTMSFKAKRVRDGRKCRLISDTMALFSSELKTRIGPS